MKKILLLLLLATFSIQAQTLQNPTYGNVKLKNNATDNSATKVNVQSTDGTINTISKSDLVNVVEVNDVPSLPLVGEVGKIYVVKNLNKIYRWNGTFYQELAGSDISSLQAQIDLKENSFTKNTAFNKNFGTTAGTVADGGYSPSKTGVGASGTWGIDISGSSKGLGTYGYVDNDVSTDFDFAFVRNNSQDIKLISKANFKSALGLGSNAYSSTAYLPLTGGTLNGAISGTSATFSSSVSATSFNGSATLTGTPTAPTAPAGTNTPQIATTAFVQANSRPYKVYTALLSQSGTNAPTAVVLENTLGGSVVWTRSSTGSYLGTLTGVFTANKTFCTTTIGAYLSGGSNSIGLVRNSVDDVFLFTNRGIAGTDAILNDASIEIRVYDSPLD